MEPPRKCTVIVADAEPLARRGLVGLVRGDPRLEISAEAESMSEARDLCARHRPDVLVLDPAQDDGFGLVKDLPRWSLRTRVVALTSLEDAASVQRAFRYGVCGYVARRDSPDAVLAAIFAAVAGERHVGARIERVLLGELARGSVQMQMGELSRLSHREMDVFRLIGQGHKTRTVAEELHVSVKTIETHRQRIREKLGLQSGVELMRRAVLFRERADADDGDAVGPQLDADR